MVASKQVVDVVDTTWSESDLAQINRPDTTIGILCLYYLE